MSTSHSGFQKLSQNSSLALALDHGLGELGGESMVHQRQLCMVFKYKTSKKVKYEERGEDYMQSRVLTEASDPEKDLMSMWKQRRESLLKSLQNVGLDVYCFYSRDRDQILVKIGASHQKLRDAAARMKYKIQLKSEYLNAYAEYRQDHPGRPELGNKDRRIISHIYKNHAQEEYPDPSSIFKTLDKIKLVHHIITSKDRDCAGVQVGKLLHQGELKAYFPLHEGPVVGDLLRKKVDWFLMGEDHANKMRDYFGDKIAFYFLFMAFYLKWLAPMAVVGLTCTFLDILDQSPDNATAIPFCILMSMWCLLMPYFWRRQEAKYAIQWGSLELEETLEHCRPEHHGEMLINPVTAEVEPHYPFKRRLLDYMLSFVVMIISAAVMLFCIFMLIYFRHEGHHHLIPGGLLTYQLGLAAYVEFSNSALGSLAGWLTNRENHRTQTDHERSLLTKVMVLKFLNSFFALYYVAFFKDHTFLFGSPMACLYDDCLIDLEHQLVIFVAFRLLISNLIEHYSPKITLWWRSCYYDNVSLDRLMYGHQTALLEMADMSETEKQAKKERYSNFDNFDEMLITHGFATIFAISSPWVCAATLFAIFVEIWVDMKSLLESRQRPMPYKARHNEPWSTAFDIYGLIAASTNVLLLIFTSHEYEGWTLTEKMTLFVYFEHLLLGARLVIQLLFPQVPRAVEILALKQENVVHRALNNVKVEQNHDFSMFRTSAGANEKLEVFEHDMLETDEAEPQLSMKESVASLRTGFMEEFATLS